MFIPLPVVIKLLGVGCEEIIQQKNNRPVHKRMRSAVFSILSNRP